MERKLTPHSKFFHWIARIGQQHFSIRIFARSLAFVRVASASAASASAAGVSSSSGSDTHSNKRKADGDEMTDTGQISSTGRNVRKKTR